ncbi:RDD family protein [uncultured Chryseobacterium sp.]|uniref:RDD family protein n=1 Tax=uncultured Chryseobacterium sp. TaxID=259322 RepID=UPI00345D9A24
MTHEYLQIVDRNRASKGSRLLNYIIDGILGYIAALLFIGFSAIIYTFVSGSSLLVVGTEMKNINPLLDRGITLSCYVLFMFLIETLTKGRSIGKMITGTRVIMIDGTKPTTKNYFIRNIIRMLPFIDQLSFLCENWFHDNWSNTRVVNLKNYETEIQAKSDIESIGTKEIP